MSTKKLLILTAVFLALLGFVVFYERFQPTSEEAAQAHRKLVDFKADAVSAITIERTDLPKVELTKPGKSWLLAGEPADGAVVSAVIADLGRLDLVGETRTAFDPKEFGLDAPRAKVTLAFAGGERTEVLFGKEIPGTDTTAAAAGARFGAVRFAPVASLVKPLDDFRSKVLFDVPASEITRLTVSRGPARVVVSRSPAPEVGKLPTWRIEEPVKDLASRTFVEQLLADLSAARIAQFPPVTGADLGRIGLQPPLVTVDLQKGSDMVASLAFGAAQADATGKLYARRGKTVVLIDDRIQEDLAKEFTAYREKKICPVDAWTTARFSVDAGTLKVGAEKVEGAWLSAGKPVDSAAVEDLLERIGRTESVAFVARKDFPAVGLPGPGRKLPAPSVVVEVTPNGESARTVRLLEAQDPGGKGRYVADVSGRADGMVVERAAVDEIRALAAKVVVKAKPTAPANPPPPAQPTPKKETGPGK
jgi:hypothetical protein